MSRGRATRNAGRGLFRSRRGRLSALVAAPGDLFVADAIRLRVAVPANVLADRAVVVLVSAAEDPLLEAGLLPVASPCVRVVTAQAVLAVEAARHLVLVRVGIRSSGLYMPLARLACPRLRGRGLLAGDGLLAARPRGAFLGLRVRAIGLRPRDLRLAPDLARLIPALVEPPLAALPAKQQQCSQHDQCDHDDRDDHSSTHP